jgi:hypothetical protein
MADLETHEPKPAGLLIVQLDGVSAPTLQRAVAMGFTPTIAGWLEAGTHQLVPWDTGLPSQTSASQAGILYGEPTGIPGFRWYEKENRKLFVSNHPGDAAEVERRLSPRTGLLEGGGSSVANLLSGDASRTALTMSALGRGLERSDEFTLFLLNPTNFWPIFVASVREILTEVAQAWAQRLRNVRPRVGRGGSFPFLRAASNVVLRDMTAHLLRRDIARGVPVAYSTFVGYDVVAHHAGPERKEALSVLRDLDRVLASLVAAAKSSPRAYDFVLLSDHGQSQGATFRQKYGAHLEELVRDLARARSVTAPARPGEGWGYLSALLSETIQGEQRTARAARTVLRPRRRGPYVEVGPDRYKRRRENAEVVVCASGSLAHIYLADWPGRLSLEGINEIYPGLIEGLNAHDGIAFVLVGSERLGPVVLGRHGLHQLDDGRVEGDDPLEPFGPAAAEHLGRLHALPSVGDLVLNGRFDASTGELNAFEELVGSHGGLGGNQTRPFLLVPSDWERPEQDLVGPGSIHELLRGRVNALEPGGPEPGA